MSPKRLRNPIKDTLNVPRPGQKDSNLLISSFEFAEHMLVFATGETADKSSREGPVLAVRRPNGYAERSSHHIGWKWR